MENREKKKDSIVELTLGFFVNPPLHDEIRSAIKQMLIIKRYMNPRFQIHNSRTYHIEDPTPHEDVPTIRYFVDVVVEVTYWEE